MKSNSRKLSRNYLPDQKSYLDPGLFNSGCTYQQELIYARTKLWYLNLDEQGVYNGRHGVNLPASRLLFRNGLSKQTFCPSELSPAPIES